MNEIDYPVPGDHSFHKASFAIGCPSLERQYYDGRSSEALARQPTGEGPSTDPRSTTPAFMARTSLAMISARGLPHDVRLGFH